MQSSSKTGTPLPESSLEGLLGTGADLMAKSDVRGALEVFRRTMAVYPWSTQAHMAAGIACKSAGDMEGSLALLGRAVDLDPDCAEARYNLGNTLLAVGRLSEAERSLRQVIALRPDWSYPHNSLGTLLLRERRLCDAVEVFRQASALDTGWYLPLYNLGLTLIQLKKDEAAVTALRSAIQQRPDFSDAHLNLALLLLRHGQFEEGFREYEWRFQNSGFSGVRTGRPQPLWEGQCRPGDTLLLCAEQGAGDLIQFVRFAKKLAEGGMRILVESPSNLSRILATCTWIAGVIGAEDPRCEADWQLPLLSVPRVLGIRLQDLSGDTLPYLSTPADDWSTLDALIGSTAGFKVGVAWTGDPRNPHNPKRSVTPKDFAPLAGIPGVQLFSLQYRDAGVPSDQLAQLGINSLGPALGDFASAAAVVERLDLTITVDTSTAHLAGALGKPVWTLLDHLPDWRWMTDPTSSVWYPTMRLYRQDRPNDWSNVLESVAQDLSQAASNQAAAKIHPEPAKGKSLLPEFGLPRGLWKYYNRRREGMSNEPSYYATSGCCIR